MRILTVLSLAFSQVAPAQIPSLVGDVYRYEVVSPDASENSVTAPRKSISAAMEGSWYSGCEYSPAFNSNLKYSIEFKPTTNSMDKLINVYKGSDGRTCEDLAEVVTESYTYVLTPIAEKPNTYAIKTTLLTRAATPVTLEVRVITDGEAGKPHGREKIPPSDIRLPARKVGYNLLQIRDGNLYLGLLTKKTDGGTLGSRPTQLDMNHPLMNTPGTN